MAHSDERGSAGPSVRLASNAGRAVITAAVLGSALAYMSDDMLNVAVPSLSGDLGVGVSEMQWVVNGSFCEDERSRAVGMYMGLTAVATAVGPVLGGLLVDLVSWRAIFIAPLVFPVAAAVVTYTSVPETPQNSKPSGNSPAC